MFDSSEQAEEAFYRAFSLGMLADMMRVWATSADIVCIHPGGPRLTGVEEIRRSWAQIFHGGMPRSFTLRGCQILADGAQRIHLLEENIRVPGSNFVSPPVLATNVYRRHAHGWRMILHHASVAPSALTLTAAREDPPNSPASRLH